MNNFSSYVYKELIKTFPEWRNIKSPSLKFLELDIPAPNNALIGGLVLQTMKDKTIWVRNYHPCSGYWVDTTEEMIKIITSIMSDQILWVIAFKSDEWFETTFVNNINDLKTENGVRYQILSWSGKFDKMFNT